MHREFLLPSHPYLHALTCVSIAFNADPRTIILFSLENCILMRAPLCSSTALNFCTKIRRQTVNMFSALRLVIKAIAWPFGCWDLDCKHFFLILWFFQLVHTSRSNYRPAKLIIFPSALAIFRTISNASLLTLTYEILLKAQISLKTASQSRYPLADTVCFFLTAWFNIYSIWGL